MSVFLPEHGSQTAVSQITPANPTVTDEDVALMERVFAAAAARPNAMPETFMAYLVDFIQTSNLLIPIGQVFGFSQFTAQMTSTVAAESTTSLSYTNLATVGPTLSGLPDGHYIVMVIALLINDTAGQASLMAPSVNGAAPTSSCPARLTASAANAPQAMIPGISLEVLANSGDNTVTGQYAVTGGTGTFNLRNILALKYSN